ncbi:MAG: tetratricopeptide repeat protein [Longimicrobiales bacterium]|nr:tetratricopeptide repeat protein [Longimicrobiales bacterium]
MTVLAMALAACGGVADAPTTDGDDLTFPPPPPPTPPTVSAQDFAGADACAPCHADQYDAWVGSTHGQAGGAPGPDVVIAPFDGRPIRFADAEVLPRIAGGSYEFVVRQDGFPQQVFRVQGVIGRAHMIGGGTQGFVSLHVDGTERFLPWDWSGTDQRWFCNTGSRTNDGWEPITSEMALADCGDWPPLRPLGTVDRFANCQECHGSQIQVELDPGSGFRTDYTSLSVNCESCHGPGRRHVELTSAAGYEPGDPAGIETLAYLDKEASLELCFRCHALKDVLREGYLPGESLERHYALKYPVLGDRPYTVDGRVRSFAYQATHLASACYLQGPMDCVSCHEPHAQGYWDIHRRPLADPFDDGQCTSCHVSKGLDAEAHTFHPPGSAGSTCVSCHMPYLQHPEVGDGVTFARSDHTIAIPRPVFDSDIGVESACSGCHEDRTALELQRQVRTWWGEIKPHRPLVEGLTTEFRARNLEEAGALLLHPDEVDPLSQFQGLSRLLTGYLQPDVDSLPLEVEDRLLELTANPDLDVRSLAAATLHWSAGEDPAIRRRLVQLLETAESSEALRSRWLLALGFMGDEARDEGRTSEATTAYRKALDLSPDDPRVLHALGQMHSQAGEFQSAVDAIRRSLVLDPARPLAWVNLGIALAGLGDTQEAREAYREALELNPHEALAHFNLGNLHQLARRYDEAAAAYERAVLSDPGLGRAHFELGRTYYRLGRFEDALPHARRAVEFMPDHPPSRAMLEELRQRPGP